MKRLTTCYAENSYRQSDSLLKHIGWNRLQWSTSALEFPNIGMKLNFDGIVKEYVADSAAGLCRNAGAEHGVANLGGDVSVIGPRPNDKPWRIGVTHPRQIGSQLQTIHLNHVPIATSRDYQRHLIVKGHAMHM